MQQLSFYHKISVNLMSTMCKSTSSLRVWVLKRPCDLFQQKYDEVERNKSQIGCMDDFLCGMCIA